MTANLKTSEIIDKAVALIVAGIGTTITFAPKIVQEGDLAFYVENNTLTDDIPAIFVSATEIDPVIGRPDVDVGGSLVETRTTLRIVIVDQWDHGDTVIAARTQRAQEVAQVFIGPAGSRYDLGTDASPIAGYDVIWALPERIELDPPESALVSLTEERQLYAVAVSVMVTGRSARV